MTDTQKMKLRINAEIVKNRSNYALFNEGMKKGAEIALSQLQHANRWRKVSENEYPEVQNEQYQILVRVSGIPYSATMWNIRNERDCDIMRRLSSSVEWKPIE